MSDLHAPLRDTGLMVVKRGYEKRGRVHCVIIHTAYCVCVSVHISGSVIQAFVDFTGNSRLFCYLKGVFLSDLFPLRPESVLAAYASFTSMGVPAPQMCP